MMECLFRATPTLVAAEESLGWWVFAYLAIALIVGGVMMGIAKKGLTGRVFKNPVTQLAEQSYLFIEHLCVSIIGPHGRRYMPFIATLWLVIFLSNVIGLFLPHAPMADWSITFGMALVVFCYVQFEGVRTNGLFGHVKHFAGPKLDGIVLVLLITPLIFCIEIVSEFAKILSLSIRLYGNISAGHVARGTIDNLVPALPVLGAFLLPLEMLVAVVQAFVFVVLTAIYLSLVTHHEGDEHDHGEESHAHHAQEAQAA
jgi:F-type H+-transporting ATPase subunit a